MNNSTPQIDLDVLRSQNPIEDIVERMTHQQLGKDHKIHCPFHADGTPSMHIYTDPDDPHFHCFSCGRHGDVIDLIGYITFGASNYDKSTHFVDVIDMLGSLDVKPLPKSSNNPKPIKRKAKTSLGFSLEDARRWHDSMKDEHWRFWVEERSLEQSTVEKFLLGWDGTRYTIPCSYRGVLFNVRRRATQRDIDANARRRRMIEELLRDQNPDEDEDAIRKMVQNRCPKLGKYLSAKNGRAGIFNLDTSLDCTDLFIVEGEIDAMTLDQFGFNAVSSTAGAATWHQQWNEHLVFIPRIYLLYDNDEAGQSGAAKVNSQIYRANNILIPKGWKDVAEIFDPDEYFPNPVGWLTREMLSFDEDP